MWCIVCIVLIIIGIDARLSMSWFHWSSVRLVLFCLLAPLNWINSVANNVAILHAAGLCIYTNTVVNVQQNNIDTK